MERSAIDSIPSHTLPVPPPQAFSMNDHSGQHYHAVDALSSNMLPTRDRMAPPEPQTKPPSTKRRKINTCFPCKQRKVKCDRQQPYCGQCQKHRIPAERCTWSSDMTLGADMHNAAATMAYPKSDTSHPSMGLSASDWTGTQGTELALDNDARAVIERISHLEQRLATGNASQPPSHELPSSSTSQTQIDPILLAGTGLSLGDVNTDRPSPAAISQDAAVAAELAFWRAKMEQHQRPSQSNDNAQMAQMQAEQNIAADALAMFARHSQQNTLAGSEQTLGRSAAVSTSTEALPRHSIVNALLDNAAFGMNNTVVRVRAALDILPDAQQSDYLLKILQTVDLHVSYGISWRLVKAQLTTHRAQLAGWNRMHSTVPENLDASFLALLLVLLGLAAQYTETRFFIDQGFCSSADQVDPYVDAWVDTAQSLLAADDCVHKTNWNHIAALLLSVDYHASRGRLLEPLVTMSILVRLAEQQGYHQLGSATEDEQQWRQAPESKLVCVSAVTATVRSGAWVRPTTTATCLPDRSHLVREAARRLWYRIMVQDMVLGTVVRRVSQMDPSRSNTSAPLNVDEEDLPDGESHILPPVKEDGRPTINNLIPHLYQIANLGREWSSMVQSGSLSYPSVLELDTKFRNLLSSLPIYLRPDPGLEQLPEVRQEQAQRPYLAMHRLTIFETVNHRLLMLHRAFMCLGHHDKKYAYSTRISVDAARTIISCRQQIDNVHPSVQRHAPFRHHLFQAVIVLTLHLLELINTAQGSSQVAHQLRDDIGVVMNYLNGPVEVRQSLPQSQKVALKLVDLLLAAANARQEKADSSSASSKPMANPTSAISTMGMDSENTSSLFHLGSSTTAANDPIMDAASAFSAQMLDPNFASSPSMAEFFASLDELMVPIY